MRMHSWHRWIQAGSLADLVSQTEADTPDSKLATSSTTAGRCRRPILTRPVSLMTRRCRMRAVFMTPMQGRAMVMSASRYHRIDDAFTQGCMSHAPTSHMNHSSAGGALKRQEMRGGNTRAGNGHMVKLAEPASQRHCGQRLSPPRTAQRRVCSRRAVTKHTPSLRSYVTQTDFTRCPARLNSDGTETVLDRVWWRGRISRSCATSRQPRTRGFPFVEKTRAHSRTRVADSDSGRTPSCFAAFFQSGESGLPRRTLEGATAS